MPKLFVVTVNGVDGCHAGILGRRVIFTGAFLVPIEDAAHEGRDQSGARYSARHSLREREEQRHVTVDAFLLQNFGGANAFPRRGDLDEDAFARNAVLSVEVDKLVRVDQERRGVERIFGSRLGRNAAGHDLRNLSTKQHQQVIDDLSRQIVTADLEFLAIGERSFDERFVLVHLGRFKNQ